MLFTRLNNALFIVLATLVAPAIAQAAAANEMSLAKKSPWHKAKLNGVSFRAIGQEPTWQLEIFDNEKAILITDYGQKKQIFTPITTQRYPQHKLTLLTGEQPQMISIKIEGEPCRDSMSGEALSAKVKIITSNMNLAGCGRTLQQ